MCKILLVLTGGTIGSFSEKGTIDVSRASAYKIVEMYYNRFGGDIEFDTVQPVNILSENMTYESWLGICRCIDEADYKKYRGIIICHGSDTLSYTSALMGMVYGKLEIPLVLIAANYGLENEKSNGLINLKSAVDLIKTGVRGIFTAYSNNRGENDIYIATRIVESEPYNDQYRSFEGSPWGKIKDGRLIVNHKPDINELKEFNGVINKSPENFKNKVMLIRPYPGMSYDNISLEGISAVVHYMYHSATACTEGKETSIIEFAKRCSEKGVKLYLASFKDRNIKEAYKSSREIIKWGGIPLFNISAEAAYAKVLLSENLKDTDINENWYFESL